MKVEHRILAWDDNGDTIDCVSLIVQNDLESPLIVVFNDGRVDSAHQPIRHLESSRPFPVFIDSPGGLIDVLEETGVDVQGDDVVAIPGVVEARNR